MKKIKKSKKKNNLNNSLGYGFFVIPLIALVFIYAIVINIMKDSAYFYISPVFKNYQPLEKKERNPMKNYFSDDEGVIYDLALYEMVNEGAEYMYEKTGVLPFVYIASAEKDESNNDILPSEKEGEQKCKEICEFFSSNGVNMAMLFLSTDTSFKVYTYATDEVRAVYGEKLERITKQYLMYNYHVIGDYGSLFEDSYRMASDRILGGFTSPISIIKENLRFFILVFSTIVVFGVSIVFYIKWNKKYGV